VSIFQSILELQLFTCTPPFISDQMHTIILAWNVMNIWAMLIIFHLLFCFISGYSQGREYASPSLDPASYEEFRWPNTYEKMTSNPARTSDNLTLNQQAPMLIVDYNILLSLCPKRVMDKFNIIITSMNSSFLPLIIRKYSTLLGHSHLW